jgi:hypothetical protein
LIEHGKGKARVARHRMRDVAAVAPDADRRRRNHGSGGRFAAGNDAGAGRAAKTILERPEGDMAAALALGSESQPDASARAQLIRDVRSMYRAVRRDLASDAPVVLASAATFARESVIAGYLLSRAVIAGIDTARRAGELARVRAGQAAHAGQAQPERPPQGADRCLRRAGRFEVKITTERVLTSAMGFGLATATNVQRAVCRARDGLPLAELRTDAAVLEAFGGAEAVDRLPSERGIKPSSFWFIAAPRIGKTTLCAAASIVDSQTADTSVCGIGEIPRVSYLSLKLDLTDVPLSKIAGVYETSDVLRELLLERTVDSLLVKQASTGLRIETKCVAGGKAAGSLAARWQANVLLDEGPKMSNREDGAVTNIDDALGVARERMLPGGQIMVAGSPWAPFGTCYDTVQEYFGKPTEHVVVVKVTGPAGNPMYWTRDRMAKLAAADPITFEIVDKCAFLDPESGLINPISLRAATRELPLELEPERGGIYGAAADPSDGAAGGNGFTLLILQRIDATPRDRFKQPTEAPRYRYRVALAREWRGLRPEQCWQQIAACCKRYGLQRAATDQYAAAANADLARRFGLSLDIKATTATSKLEDFTNLATLMHSGAIELSPEPQLMRDLLSVKRRVTQSGTSIALPRTSDGRHADYAPALAAALRSAGAWNKRSDGGWGLSVVNSDGRVRHYDSTSSSRDMTFAERIAERRRRMLNDE